MLIKVCMFYEHKCMYGTYENGSSRRYDHYQSSNNIEFYSVALRYKSIDSFKQ